MKRLIRTNINGEEVCLRKGFDGYRVVYPFRNEDGSFNWFNFTTGGSYWKLVKLAIFVVLIFIVILLYKYDMQSCVDLTERIVSDPAGFCRNVTTTSNSKFTLNLTEFDYLKNVTG